MGLGFQGQFHYEQLRIVGNLYTSQSSITLSASASSSYVKSFPSKSNVLSQGCHVRAFKASSETDSIYLHCLSCSEERKRSIFVVPQKNLFCIWGIVSHNGQCCTHCSRQRLTRRKAKGILYVSKENPSFIQHTRIALPSFPFLSYLCHLKSPFFATLKTSSSFPLLLF